MTNTSFSPSQLRTYLLQIAYRLTLSLRTDLLNSDLITSLVFLCHRLMSCALDTGAIEVTILNLNRQAVVLCQRVLS